MRNQLGLAAAVVGLTSCQPSPEELTSKFTNRPDVFVQLREMVTEDTGEKDCFAVGLDNIGDYRKLGDKWSDSRDFAKKLDLPQVLESARLSNARYDAYKKLFVESGSERVSLCRTGQFGPEVSVLVYRGGLSVSGCSGTINWRGQTPLAFGPGGSLEMRDQTPDSYGKLGEGDFTEITPLSGGWYLEFSCT